MLNIFLRAGPITFRHVMFINDQCEYQNQFYSLSSTYHWHWHTAYGIHGIVFLTMHGFAEFNGMVFDRIYGLPDIFRQNPWI